ncbi:MAG TPA: ATP-binding protein [Candidatus Thermoplasmatota archaeon]|nr:ATP-binding protein [Candidatus Thermoplasmatota archaeon]
MLTAPRASFSSMPAPRLRGSSTASRLRMEAARRVQPILWWTLLGCSVLYFGLSAWVTRQGLDGRPLGGAGLWLYALFVIVAAVPLLIRSFHDATLVAGLEERSRRLAEDRNAALRVAEAKASMVAQASHEINTPLGSILGFAQLLQHTELKADQRAHVANIQEAAEHLRGLVEGILDLAKVEARRVQLASHAFSVPEVLESCSHAVDSLRARHGTRLRIEDLTPHGRRYLGDATRVRQVLINLLSNAVKFAGAGNVHVLVQDRATAPGRRELRFVVRDDGPGIQEADVERLFEPFFHRPAPGEAGGTGLGLPISRRLCELMGGSLTAANSPGGGAVFTAVIVVAEGESPPAPLPAPAPAPVRVLIVDDDPLSRAYAVAAARRMGNPVEVVASGADALARVAQEPFDLVLMDLQMQPMGGIETARRMRALPGPPPRIVALSASADDDLELARAAGMDDAIAKPLELGRFAALLRDVAARRSHGGPAAALPAPPAALPSVAAVPPQAIPGP